MDLNRLSGSIGKAWETSIVDRLVAYVRIPNKSPMFDPQWERNGHMEAAVQLMAQWCRAQPLTGRRVEVRRLPGRTPLLLLEVPGELPGSVLLYGHLDKQPEFTGWLPGLGPWEPVIREGRLYGRGAADDGYAVFSPRTSSPSAQPSGSPRWWCAWMRSAATTISCGARPRCAATWSARCACACSPRACIPAWPPASRRLRFAFSSSSWPVSRIRSPAICCSMSCT